MVEVPDLMPAHVSVENEFPEDLFKAMAAFIQKHPEWDQYRLIQASVAAFLFQQGGKEPAVVQHYLNGLFQRPRQSQAQVQQR
jgi:hypothetical protein